MKKHISAIAATLILGAATGAHAVSTTATFQQVSNGAFTQSFLLTPDAANTLVLRVSGTSFQFSGLAFSLWDGATSLVSQTAGSNQIAIFSDLRTTAFDLVGGKTYTLKVTGNSIGAPNTSIGTVYATNGVVSAVPEPESYALLLAGLGLVGTVARRRIRKTAA
ncbi:FxDxF family PEP-CTERM protein [Rhodoferax sp.]|uniref:FxDxF family PEP-CTERM protein n=1 Tax=Rhodoferax sp. TaxID=50421 RepID=UPI002ACD3300|nr:FxDxF family PEP-CTERM protein [Rhodoferax sp.]MDZ7919500.1 FxDxF family PEP-CTERM protein [Rhodoferax sp.]